jgi:hypothetical protein
MDKITAEVEMLEVGDGEEERLRSSVQRKILGELQYPAMTNRYEEVLQAHPQTFDWIFCDTDDEEQPWSNFGTWLRESETKGVSIGSMAKQALGNQR